MDLYEEDTEKEFERRKWAFLRDVDKVYKMLEEEMNKPPTEQLQPPSLLEKWEAYFADIKATCEAAKTPDDLPLKIDRVSKLDKLVQEHWPVSNDLSEYLFIIEEQWGVFR